MEVRSLTLRVNKKPTRRMNFTNAKVFMIYMLLSALKPKCRGYYVQVFPHYHSNFEVCNSKREHITCNYLVRTHLLSISHFKNIAGIEKISNDTKAITISKNVQMAHNWYNLQKPSINWRILSKNAPNSNKMFSKICNAI